MEKRLGLLTLALALAVATLRGQVDPSLTELAEGSYLLERDVSYLPPGEPDAYRRERARLDVYYPAGADTAARPVVVWFHGGGLTGGQRHLPDGLRRAGFVVVVAEYRLAPRARVTDIVDDAAAAVAWVLDHAERYGGNPDAVFVTGHSAGGYLASMIALDTARLGASGHHPRELAGVAPLSGHAVTHFTERAARALPGERIVADSLAPIFFVRGDDLPPLLLITGDRELELLGRYEENAFFWRMLRVAGAERVRLHELEGYGHDVVAPALPLVRAFVDAYPE